MILSVIPRIGTSYLIFDFWNCLLTTVKKLHPLWFRVPWSAFLNVLFNLILHYLHVARHSQELKKELYGQSVCFHQYSCFRVDFSIKVHGKVVTLKENVGKWWRGGEQQDIGLIKPAWSTSGDCWGTCGHRAAEHQHSGAKWNDWWTVISMGNYGPSQPAANV